MDAANALARSNNERWGEDLRLQAVRGARAGRALCTCETSYHVIWSALRAAGQTSSLHAEEGVLSAILSDLIADGTRILIAGAADTGTFCVVGRASGQRTPEITVLDHCLAPLKLIDDFAAERSHLCRTVHLDLLNLDEAGHWDIILLHYTLSFFAPAERCDVVRRLSRALAPGGKLICSTRTGTAPKPAEFDLVASAWYQSAMRKIEEARLELPLTAEEVKSLLHQYERSRMTRKASLAPLAEVKQLFTGAGLSLTGEIATPRRRTLQLEGAGKSDVESSVILTATRPR